ncbi:MAG: FIST C-terminal domain-containing protein [Calothrix sp. MO_167.B42]|nr:FIST C-terminal domain-containing protein [Calothrix sp. MO_167.B42]
MFKVVVAHSDDPDSQDAITEILQQCNRDLGGIKPQAGILFAAIDFEHELILQGLKQVLGEEVPIVGGTAGDQFRFENTYQFFGDRVLNDSLPILTFSGDILLSYGIACGWHPIGRKSIVTKAKDTVLYEIDGKPAVEYYQKYLGDRPPSAENPLAVYEGDSDRYYMRVPNTHDPQVGSINFLGDIPEQSVVQLTDISRDEVIAASEISFNQALKTYPGNEPEAVLLFSCCCRRWLLGTRAKEEYQLVKKAFPQEIPICGFYTYGEFAPLQPNSPTYYHQETFVTLLIGSQ